MTEPNTFIKVPEVCRRLGVCRTTLYKWVAKGHFPPVRKVGPQRSAVLASDLNEWMQSRPPSSKCKEKAA